MNHEKIINQFTPRLPADTWELMDTFVRETIRTRYAEGRSAAAVRDALTYLTTFADWVLLTGIGDLDSDILTSEVIDAYTATRTTAGSGSVVQRERKVLLKMAGVAASPEHSRPSTSSSPSIPYTTEQQSDIRRWADSQASAKHRRNASTIAALGLGCGLTASEMMSIQRRHITMLDDGMVGVRTTDRIVPVTAAWNDDLSALRTLSATTFLIDAGSGLRSSTVTHIVSELRRTYAHPSAQRMRATWMVNLLSANVPVPVVMSAAGLRSADVLRRLLPFITVPDPAACVELLRLNGAVR